MQIIWQGQSFFQILIRKGKESVIRIAIDPFDEQIGLKPRPARQILCWLLIVIMIIIILRR